MKRYKLIRLLYSIKESKKEFSSWIVLFLATMLFVTVNPDMPVLVFVSPTQHITVLEPVMWLLAFVLLVWMVSG